MKSPEGSYVGLPQGFGLFVVEDVDEIKFSPIAASTPQY